ncbi:DEAD/DEAH box helicase family protein [Limimaricola sp. G21655-S1]|uniref:DEAD/DEAH box helicase family protein n=1 Tax=Limimaricola sp. G21655-S1 TaxID=3014768 RepID=UPI0022AE5B0F|nr:DEAD/DEAH box helicase family protein [Limimaricola sp. G21655-S1]MCZ4262229.1 DEAD/DEAH box helicase family protein [Limimaricola sp. G21655-S1]
MKHEQQFEPTIRVPFWSEPSDARDQLRQKIEEFVQGAAEKKVEPNAALALKVTAGLGKTATMLRMIARHGEALLARGHVMIFVPTLELAERAHEEFQALAPSCPSRVIRGREAAHPDDRNRQMCERAELAKSIASFVPSVTKALCRSYDSNGYFVASACAEGCPYLGQKDTSGPHVVFLSHAYLTVHPPVDSDVPVALRVIDEKVWPSLIRTMHLSVEDFMGAPPATYLPTLRPTLLRARAAILEGLQSNAPLRDHLLGVNVTADKLNWLEKAEAESREYLNIGPWHPPRRMQEREEKFDKRSFTASRKRQQIFARLADDATGGNGSMRLYAKKTEDGAQQVIEVPGLADVPRDAPLLLLDADADPNITEHVFPGARFESILSKPTADIVQISDVTASNSWLLDARHGRQRRGAVLTILKREVGRAANDGVLVVATKAVLQALHADVGNSVEGSEREALRQPLLGADPRWFGPSTQGVNDFENYATIIVIGRLQPDTASIEASARAVFAKDERPIALHSSGPLPAAAAQQLLADGSSRELRLRAHPDPRAQAILAQTRECGTLQAIARLRLVSPSRSKRVVILSNLPLHDFPVTHLTTFRALELDLEKEPDVEGFERLEKALAMTLGQPMRGTRLSEVGLAADLPHSFRTEAVAHAFRRGRDREHMIALCERIAATNGWQIVPLELRRTTGGKAVPAIILDCPGDPLSTAKALWPDLEPSFPP